MWMGTNLCCPPINYHVLIIIWAPEVKSKDMLIILGNYLQKFFSQKEPHRTLRFSEMFLAFTGPDFIDYLWYCQNADFHSSGGFGQLKLVHSECLGVSMPLKVIGHTRFLWVFCTSTLRRGGSSSNENASMSPASNCIRFMHQRNILMCIWNGQFTTPRHMNYLSYLILSKTAQYWNQISMQGWTQIALNKIPPPGFMLRADIKTRGQGALNCAISSSIHPF